MRPTEAALSLVVTIARATDPTPTRVVVAAQTCALLTLLLAGIARGHLDHGQIVAALAGEAVPTHVARCVLAAASCVGVAAHLAT